MLQIGSVSFSALQAQNTSEIGLSVGAMNYKGEIAPNFRLGNSQPGASVFYKKDISKPVTLRVSALLGRLKATDRDLDLPYHQARRAEMLTTRLIEGAFGMEYNFLDYYDQRRRFRWTPYYFISLALFNYDVRNVGNPSDPNNIYAKENRSTTTSVSIPTGVGVKLALSYHWNLGLEFGARKTFTDLLDNLDDNNTAVSNPYDNDWYYYTGVSISYTFYKLRCPGVYKNTPGLLD